MLKHISGAQKCIPGTRRKPHHVAQPQTQPSHIKAQPTNFKTCNCNPGGEKPKLNLTILVFLSKNIFGGGQGSQRGKQPRFILKKQTTFTPGGMKLPTFVCCCRGTDERGWKHKWLANERKPDPFVNHRWRHPHSQKGLPSADSL